MILCHADGPTDNPKWRFRCGNGGGDDGSPGVSWTISRLQDYRLEQLQGEKVGNSKINQSINQSINQRSTRDLLKPNTNSSPSVVVENHEIDVD